MTDFTDSTWKVSSFLRSGWAGVERRSGEQKDGREREGIGMQSKIALKIKKKTLNF